MKHYPFHFILLLAVTLTLSGGLVYGQDTQARPKKPRSFEDYTPRSLKEIAAMKPDPNSLRDKQDNLFVTADDLPSRVRVTYTGSTRPIPQLKKEVIRQWARLYAGSIEHYTEPYQTEMFFIENGVGYWLAIPKDSPLLSQQSFKKGERLDLYLIRLGAAIAGGKYDWMLLVEKLQKADTAQGDESWPSLEYLRNDYRSVSVVAHVLVREAEVVKKIGGYEDWRVVCEVVEPFKGKFRRNERIEYYHGAEAGLRKEWFNGEKIVFLLHRHYEPEKRWIYSVLENSTLPYTKDRVEKLRLIERSLQPRRHLRSEVKISGFEKTYMPKVGRKITVAGVFESAKLGFIVTFDNGGIYIYPVHAADTSKMNAFDSFKGQTVEVTGTLRYSRGSSAQRAGEVSIPEHFFFDAAEVKVVPARPRAPGSGSPSSIAPGGLVKYFPELAHQRHTVLTDNETGRAYDVEAWPNVFLLAKLS